MSAGRPPRVKLLSDLQAGDVVLTPSAREARVSGFDGDRVMLVYLDATLEGAEGVTLAPHHLRLVRREAHQPLARSRIVESSRREPKL